MFIALKSNLFPTTILFIRIHACSLPPTPAYRCWLRSLATLGIALVALGIALVALGITLALSSFCCSQEIFDYLVIIKTLLRGCFFRLALDGSLGQRTCVLYAGSSADALVRCAGHKS